MRWDDLFADLEAQLVAAEAADLAAEVADRSRREVALLTFVDRARAAGGATVRLRVAGVGVVDGVLAEVGQEWLLLAEPTGRQSLVPMAAVLSVSGLGLRSAAPGSGGRVFERLGLASALRAIARDRSPLTVWLGDGSAVSGTIDRVGADFMELRVHAAGEVAPRGEPLGVRTVPLAAVAVVRRAG